MNYAYEAAEELSPIPLSPRGLVMAAARQIVRGAGEESFVALAGQGNMCDDAEITQDNSVSKYLPGALKWLDSGPNVIARDKVTGLEARGQTMSEARDLLAQCKAERQAADAEAAGGGRTDGMGMPSTVVSCGEAMGMEAAA